jgi:broad-specificity NMP kinase
MGVRNYLIEGVSGVGKTAVCTQLQRRGYQAIHGDRELAYRGDPETGLPTAPEMDRLRQRTKLNKNLVSNLSDARVNIENLSAIPIYSVV